MTRRRPRWARIGTFGLKMTCQKAKKEFRNKPPTEEERAALKAAKEQEKLAKAQAKALANNLGPDELKERQAQAVAVSPVASSSGSAQKTVSVEAHYQ